MNLLDIYEESSGMMDYLDNSFRTINEDISKWNSVVVNHLSRLTRSPNIPRIPSIFDAISGQDWINLENPLSEGDLKERILILDFFTFCCINCDQILPILKSIEEDFTDNSTLLIGVHSPKFPHEKNIHSVKAAVSKKNIKHPVLNDPNLYLWKMFSIYCWPTVLIIGPRGNVLFSLIGEMQIDKLPHLVEITKNFIFSKNLPLNTSPLPIALVTETYEEILYYPSYVTMCGNVLFISDTGHHRIIVINLFGAILEIIGSGDCGSDNGYFSKATFNNPRGTAWCSPSVLFVADTGNHCIRAIDFKSKTVCTVFDGRMHPSDHDLPCKEFEKPKFLSPWDVCLGPKLESSDMTRKEVLYVAVAGSHQIWALTFSESESQEWYLSVDASPFAGNGREECRNNTYKMLAGFAQPSAITYSLFQPGILFIADSESSAIRSISLKNGRVQTVVGGGLDPMDLFQFGDDNGTGLEVNLQHPLGVCVSEDGNIIISDTYNHKIKSINYERKECRTLVLEPSNENEYPDGIYFQEPSGIFFDGITNIVFVADTNNHCIKCIDLEKKTVTKMKIFHSDEIDDSCYSFLCSTRVDLGINFYSVILNAFSNTEVHVRDINLKKDGKICCYFLLLDPVVKLEIPTAFSVSFKGECEWEMRSAGEIFDIRKQPSLQFISLSEQVSKDSIIKVKLILLACNEVTKSCYRTIGEIILHVKVKETGWGDVDLRIVV